MVFGGDELNLSADYADSRRLIDALTGGGATTRATDCADETDWVEDHADSRFLQALPVVGVNSISKGPPRAGPDWRDAGSRKSSSTNRLSVRNR